MRTTLKHISGYFADRIGLTLLLIILIAITIANLKPDFYLVGWDNYSSYFNLKTNLFRTLFATWRDYRGLGAPSDAEVTDIFRQLFYWVVHFFIPEKLLDQVYYLSALWVGVIGIYACACTLIEYFHFRQKSMSEGFRDIFGFLAGALYLFNLNTLSVFYSPIIPFTNRFYSLPLTLYVFLRFLRSKNKAKSFLAVVFTVVVTSGSYITPTVLITSIMAFFLFIAFQWNIKKAVLSCLLFLLLNAFWILPFLNYTVEKSSIIPLARTFVEINESTLNQSSVDFSLEKQSILFPSFFSLSFRPLSGKNFPIHPLLDSYTKGLHRYALFLFPIVYSLGTLFILTQWQKNKKVLWIPLWMFVFLFLSMKELGPLGWIYTWLKEHIPLFDVVFRISDTKFHAYISLAGSIAGAYAILFIFSSARLKSARNVGSVVLLSLALWYISLFRTYFTGDLIGFFVYTKIPQAYYEIANTINTTPGHGRVLHLPMDIWHNYWRSFSWGYIGSSFFHYFVDTPYIDKTFEPASLENTYLHTKLTRLVDSFYRTTDEAERREVAAKFLHLMRQTGIEYVLVDESISSNVYARNMLFNAKQWYIQPKEILEYIEQEAGVTRVGVYPVSLQELYSQYEALYPARIIGSTRYGPENLQVHLYKVNAIAPVVGFASTAQNIHPDIANLLEIDIDTGTVHMVQDTGKSAQLVPFMQQDHLLKRDGQAFTLEYTNPHASEATYQLHTTPGSTDSYLIDIEGAVQGNVLSLDFHHRYYPDINGQTFSQRIGSVAIPLSRSVLSGGHKATLLSNWTQDTTDQILDNMRLKINDIILPVPADIMAKSQHIGSYMLHEKSIRVSLLTKTAVHPVAVSTFLQTDPASCFGAPQEEHQGALLMPDDTHTELVARNGSFCVRSPVVVPNISTGKPLYAEIELQLRGRQLAEEDPKQQRIPRSSFVRDVLKKNGENPAHAYVCLREGSIAECLNLHRNARVGSEVSLYRIPLRSFVSPHGTYSLDVGVVSFDAIKQALEMTLVQQHLYAVGTEQTIAFTPTYPEESVQVSGPVRISFPKAVSAYSYFHKPHTEFFSMPLESCRGDHPAPRTVRLFGDVIVSNMENCSVHFAQWFTYAPSHAYLFGFDYWLGSGQQPSIVLGREGDNYFFERASLYQGYPATLKMKQFQNSHAFSFYGQVANKLNNMPLVSASRFLDPLFVSDSAPADAAMHIFQDTANEGTLAVGSFDMIEYPTAWQKLTLIPSTSHSVYPVTTRYTYKQLLPSLWRVDGSIPPGMLLLNVGFDEQWGIYDSLWAVAFGQSITNSVRCDGYANCFDLAQKGRGEYKTVYLFYWPERLSIMGWAVTVLVVVVALNIARTRSRRA